MNQRELWKDEIQLTADSIRIRVLGHVMSSNGGYLSQACSSAEMLAMLYKKMMHLGESEAPLVPQPFAGVPGFNNPDFFNGGVYNGPQTPYYDRFIFSPAHYALVLYATLIEVGRLAVEGLKMFNQDGTTVEMIGAEHSPGIETTTGSLAQALSQAGGIALARKLKGDTGRVFVMMTDGEFQEGQTWEAVQALSHYNLDNVYVYADINGQQCDGAMDAVMNIEPLTERLSAFGARVFDIDGHNLDALHQPSILAPDGRPTFVVARTDPARGVDILREKSPELHYLRFSSEAERERYQAHYFEMKKAHVKQQHYIKQIHHFQKLYEGSRNGHNGHQ